MKQLLYSVMALCLLSGGLVACGSDDDEDARFDTRAEQDAQGTYSGEFVRVQYGTTDTVRAAGTLILLPTDTVGRARIAFASDELTELEPTTTVPLNISHADQGFTFFNKSADDVMLGRVDGAQNVTVKFSKAVRSGRSTRRYNYEFNGRR